MYFNKNGRTGLTAETIVANESYDIEIGGGLIAVQEAMEDIVDINSDIAVFECNATDAFVKEGSLAGFEPVAEGFFGDLYEKIISALKKLWEKLKGFFKTAVKYFDGLFLSAKKFAEKYEDELKGKELDGFKFTMYNYTLDKLNIDKIFTDVQKEINNGAKLNGKANEDIVDKKKDIAREIMSKLAGGSVSNSEAYSTALFKLLRDSKSEKREISPKVSEIIATLKDNEDLSKCKDAESDCDEAFKDVIEKIEENRKAAQDSSSGTDKSKEFFAKRARLRHSYFVQGKELAMKAFTAYKTAVSERDSAFKSCLSAALHHKKSKD